MADVFDLGGPYWPRISNGFRIEYSDSFSDLEKCNQIGCNNIIEKKLASEIGETLQIKDGDKCCGNIKMPEVYCPECLAEILREKAKQITALKTNAKKQTVLRLQEEK